MAVTLLFEGRYIGVAPQIFQFVKLARFGVEDVDYDVKIVKAYPVGVPPTRSGFGQLVHLLLQTLLHVVGDRGYLGGAFTFADEEKLRRSVVQFAQVETDDVLTLDVTDGVQD